jgi:uncharacterized protein YjbI with pentapeptide repeats
MTMAYTEVPPTDLREGDIFNGKMFISKKDFRNAGYDGKQFYFERIILTDCDFRGANLNSACFDSSIIDGSDFTGAIIHHTSHKILWRNRFKTG